MQPVFRPAAPQDAPAIASLLALAWQKAYRGILSDELLQQRGAHDGAVRIRTGIETRPEYRYRVLETGGQLAGVSVVCPYRDEALPDTAEIMVFYIHPDLQGQGLGRVLMEHTLAETLASGVPNIALWVLKDNLNARGFYETMGFRFDGTEKAMPNLENVAAVRYLYHGEGA